MNREVGSYDEDNSESNRFEGDDVGLPESPIYSNFSKNLWRTHTRHGLVQSPNRSRENNGRASADAGRVVTRLKMSRSWPGVRGTAMGSLFAMRRANGDWFALDERGRFRVPVFSSQWDGTLARVSNWGMQLFKPVALDGRSLGELVPPDGAGETDFWLVETPFTSLNRGRLIDRAQLSLLVIVQ